MDPQRLLDFIEQQADTRMTAREVFGSSLRDKIDATAGEIVEAVADMYADKTGERFILDTDALREANDELHPMANDTTVT